MNKKHLLLGSLALLLLPAVAHARSEGVYVGGSAGVNFTQDSKTNFGAASTTTKYDIGPAGLISLGYGFANGLRTELEGGYRHNTVQGVSNNNFAIVGPGGKIDTWSIMGNVLYDFNTGTPFTPYIGAGVGMGVVSARLTGTNFASPVYKGTDSDLAYQGIAGASYEINKNLSLTADYRYFATTDTRISGNAGKWKVENDNHTVSVGLRWTFTPPAQPVITPTKEVPAPRVVPEFIVFFDWNKSAITSQAAKVISDAIAAAGEYHAIALNVVGHTDSSGSAGYNQKLSEKRASVVKQELIKRGFDSSRIVTSGHGKNDLMVQTPDGVREPSNRRAQIVLSIQ
ncbi:Outer membrane protein OmpA-like peptidoglycan-associated protein [Azospirillaceae bacterium]